MKTHQFGSICIFILTYTYGSLLFLTRGTKEKSRQRICKFRNILRDKQKGRVKLYGRILKFLKENKIINC
jgi:hypothetical protein